MIVLPIKKPWFKLLIKYAALIGAVGGLLAVAYITVTSLPIEKIFGSTTGEYWSGKWWWVPFTAFGGLLVALLRKYWKIPEKIPGAIEVGQEAIVDRASLLKLVVISAVSLIFGASLGPSYGIIMLSAGFGSWIFSKLKISKDKEVEREYTRVGMSSGLGGVFSDPLLGTLFTIELSPSKKNQLASSVTQLIGAAFGFIVYVGITGTTLLKAYALPDYDFRFLNLLQGAALGVVALIILLLFLGISKLVKKFLDSMPSVLIKGIVGGAIVGLTAYFLPIATGSGNSQLVFATQEYATFSLGFIVVVLLVKIVAVAVSMESGFLGGNVFPMLFLGGMSGLLVHSLFPGIPVALCVSALMAAVPGATLSTPLSIILVAVAGVGLGTSSTAPVIMAVIVAQLGIVSFQFLMKKRKTDPQIA